jgi:hypothetical protein
VLQSLSDLEKNRIAQRRIHRMKDSAPRRRLGGFLIFLIRSALRRYTRVSAISPFLKKTRADNAPRSIPFSAVCVRVAPSARNMQQPAISTPVVFQSFADERVISIVFRKTANRRGSAEPGDAGLSDLSKCRPTFI